MSYEFHEAATEAEFEQIRRLNHLAFADELGQHPASPDGRLVDSREARSRYFVALRGERVVGMVCASMIRPFSVESRLPDAGVIDSFPQPHCEVRLLAIERDHRNTLVISGLLLCLLRAILAEGAGTLLISGVVGRVEMYQRLGFKPLGPPVPQGQTAFVPMALRLDDLPELVRRGAARGQRRSS